MEDQYPRGEREDLCAQMSINSASIGACRWTSPWVRSFALRVRKSKPRVTWVSAIMNAQVSDTNLGQRISESSVLSCSNCLGISMHTIAVDPLNPACYASPREEWLFPGGEWRALGGMITVPRTFSSQFRVQNSQSRQLGLYVSFFCPHSPPITLVQWELPAGSHM